MKPSSVILFRVFPPFALGFLLSYLFRTVNAVIAPDLMGDIGLEPAQLGLLTSAYFLSFAAFQLPLGVLLDRYDPRRVEAVLLLFAAAGAYVFSQADTMTMLVVGRALIGFGVSACLMAAFKTFTIWLPPEKLPLANGVQMVFGGLGALAATAPVEAALSFTDWRGVFLALAVSAVVISIIILFVVPPSKERPSGETFRQQLKGIRMVFTSRIFWQIAPWAIAAQSAYLSIQGLWSGPWLRDVAGFDREATAYVLLRIAVAMTIGYLVFGALAERLSRRGIKPSTVAAVGMGLFMTVQLFLIFPGLFPAAPVWMAFGFFGTACSLPYAVLSQNFPRHLSGRANTALNLSMFFCAFIAQWSIGAIIGLWPGTAAGGYSVIGYQTAFGAFLGLELIGAGWFFLSENMSRRKESGKPAGEWCSAAIKGEDLK